MTFDRLAADEREALRGSALPESLPVMLATLTDDRFSDPEWIFERKLDGVRCVARRTARGAVRLLSRGGQDLTRTFPEVAQAVAECGSDDLMVDGEVVAFDGPHTSFER